jgi:hypothetical protein
MTDLFDVFPNDKREVALQLDSIYRDVTGWQPKLWRKMLGYGQYRYRTKSGQQGEFFATGFNLRARDIALHILPGYSDFPEIAKRLGPHKRGKSCWYIKSLQVVEESALRDLIAAGLADLAKHATIEAT